MGRVNYPDIMSLIAHPQVAEIMPNLLKGYEAGTYPARQREEERQKMIQSQLQQYQLNDYPERSKLEMENNRAKLAHTLAETAHHKINTANTARQLEEDKGFDQLLRNAVSKGQNRQQGQSENIFGAQGAQEAGGNPGEDTLEQEKNKDSVINEGNPALYPIDELFLEHPEYANKFKKRYGDNIGSKTVSDKNTGETIHRTMLPSGRVIEKRIQTGERPADRKFYEAMAKKSAEAYGENQERLVKGDVIESSYDEMVNLINTEPGALKEIIGFANSKKPLWSLSKPLQKIAGTVNTIQGYITLDTGKDIKGPWNGRDDTLVNNTKPSASDPYETWVAKVKANQLIIKQMKKRRQLYGEMLYNRVPPHKAAEMAEQQTSLDKIRPQIEKMFVQNFTKEDLTKENIQATADANGWSYNTAQAKLEERLAKQEKESK